MKFSLSAAVLALAVSVAALPQKDVNAAGNGVGNKGNANVRFPVPDNMTVKQATEKCGDQAQLSCCNKATWAGDVTDVDEGILAGTLKNLIGGGSGSEGLGLFDQCSKLDLQSTLSFSFKDRSSILTYSSRHSCDSHPGSGQPAVQAEHCLLPELSFRCRKSSSTNV
jgi:hypothetical protein